jgi:hypothetical protein
MAKSVTDSKDKSLTLLLSLNVLLRVVQRDLQCSLRCGNHDVQNSLRPSLASDPNLTLRSKPRERHYLVLISGHHQCLIKLMVVSLLARPLKTG